MADFKTLKQEYWKVKARNKTLSVRMEKMRQLAGVVQKLGATPIIYMHPDSEPTGDVGFTECAKLSCTYVGKIQKVLLTNNILRKEDNLWIVDEAYQSEGWFVYHYGVLGSYTRFYLKITPKGVAIIQRYLAEHASTRKYKKQKNE